MATNICPACGYPTLGPDLCAFCRPGEVLAGLEAFGPMPSTATMRPGSAWVGVRDEGSTSATYPIVLSGPLAS
jgi:hypothetical protein